MNEKNRETVEQESMQQGKLTGKQKKWIWIAVLTPLLLLSLFLLYRHFNGGEEPEFVIGANVQEGTLNKDEEEGADNGKSAMSITLNGYPVFENGESAGDLNIENPANNALYMEVQITLDETGEVIYESGGIPPGHFIDNDKLTTVLEQGEHSATALVTIVDPENLSQAFNSANFDLLITVKN